MKIVLLLVLLGFGGAGGLHAQESLTWESLAESQALWPKEVTVKIGHEVPIVVGGKTSGSMQVPAGRIYPLTELTADGVVVDAMGSPLTFAAADTDLLTRAEKVREQQEARAVAAATAAAAATPEKVKATPTPEKATTPQVTNVLAGELEGDLVALDGRKLKKFEAADLAGKKFLAIYFSAGWCPPCRTFTPKLVKWYKRKKSKAELFDIIFVSSDKTEEAMEEYMKDEKMPWPALAFGKKSKSPLRKYGGRGIPCLVIVDAKGEVLAHSYEGENYVGPNKVLDELDKLLKGG